jgi:hypothetical protein
MEIMQKSTKYVAIVAMSATLLLPFAAFADNSVGVNVNAGTNVQSGDQHDDAMSKKTHKIHAATKVGTVTVLSPLTFTAGNGGTYTIDTSATKFLRAFGAKMSLADIQVGDKIQVRGVVTASSIAATMIRDMSLQAKNGTFTGKVQSVTGNSFTVLTGRGVQTVNLGSSTVIKKNNQSGTIADITVGANIKVSGVWDRANSNITATKVSVIIRMVGINLKGTFQSASGTTLTLLGNDNATYTVDASKARFSYKGGRKGDATLLQANDKVQVQGKHVDGSTSIMASSVRDLSQTKKDSTSDKNNSQK